MFPRISARWYEWKLPIINLIYCGLKVLNFATNGINSLWPSDAIWQYIWVNIGSGNGFMPDSNKPLTEPMLIDNEWFLWHTPQSSFTVSAQVISQYNEFENDT